MQRMDSQPPKRNDGRAIFGTLLVLVGGLLVINAIFDLNFTYRIKHIFWSWQMLLIVIGGFSLINNRDKTLGSILILIGVVFIIPRVFPHWHFVPFGRLFWPIILIGIGLIILFRGTFSRRHPRSYQSLSKDYIDDTAIFGGGERIVTSKNFKGGKVTAVFGGSNINFLDSELAEGKNIIDVFCVFGGNTFIVPPDWNVIIELTPIFGGYSDQRRNIPNLITDTNKELYIKGFVLFGGGEVRSTLK